MRDELINSITAIFREAEHKALALIHSIGPEGGTQAAQATEPQPDPETQRLINQHRLIAQKTYLTRKEAAVYLSVSERSIAEWSVRPPDQNPFPEENAGGEPRYRRAAIDEWTRREKQRQRLKVAG